MKFRTCTKFCTQTRFHERAKFRTWTRVRFSKKSVVAVDNVMAFWEAISTAKNSRIGRSIRLQAIRFVLIDRKARMILLAHAFFSWRQVTNKNFNRIGRQNHTADNKKDYAAIFWRIRFSAWRGVKIVMERLSNDILTFPEWAPTTPKAFLNELQASFERFPNNLQTAAISAKLLAGDCPRAGTPHGPLGSTAVGLWLRIWFIESWSWLKVQVYTGIASNTCLLIHRKMTVTSTENATKWTRNSNESKMESIQSLQQLLLLVVVELVLLLLLLLALEGHVKTAEAIVAITIAASSSGIHDMVHSILDFHSFCFRLSHQAPRDFRNFFNCSLHSAYCSHWAFAIPWNQTCTVQSFLGRLVDDRSGVFPFL